MGEYGRQEGGGETENKAEIRDGERTQRGGNNKKVCHRATRVTEGRGDKKKDDEFTVFVFPIVVLTP